MSLDLSIGNYEGNYTYNLGKIWYYFYPEAEGMVDIEGKTGAEVVNRLINVIEWIENDYDELVKLNPINGWGDLDSFYLWLCELRLQCFKYPNEKWEADR